MQWDHYFFADRWVGEILGQKVLGLTSILEVPHKLKGLIKVGLVDC
jgi:hypothetical protein